jgi:hypothetical protein
MHTKYQHIRFSHRSGMMILTFMLFLTEISWAQADKKFIRNGNREYEKNKFPGAEKLLIKTKGRLMLYSIQEMHFINRRNMRMPGSSSLKLIK